MHGTESRSIVVWEEFSASYSIVKWYQYASIEAQSCARLLSVRLSKHWAVEPSRLALSNRNSSRSRRGDGLCEWSEADFLIIVSSIRVSLASDARFYTFYTATLRTRTALVIWATTDSTDFVQVRGWRAAIQLVSRSKYCVFRAIIVNNLLQRCLT